MQIIELQLIINAIYARLINKVLVHETEHLIKAIF